MKVISSIKGVYNRYPRLPGISSSVSSTFLPQLFLLTILLFLLKLMLRLIFLSTLSHYKISVSKSIKKNKDIFWLEWGKIKLSDSISI